MKSFLIILFVVQGLLFAQNYYPEKYINISNDQLVKEQTENLINVNGCELLLIHKKNSPYSVHYTYSQAFNGISVYDSQVKVNIAYSGKLHSFSLHNLITVVLDEYSIDEQGIVSKIISKHNLIEGSYRWEKSWYKQNAEIMPVIVFTICTGVENYFELIIDKNQNELFRRDLNLYFYDSGTDTIVKASVFLPDPLTTAGVVYGNPYVDASDTDVSEIVAQQVQENIKIIIDASDTFRLENEFVKITEHSNPIVYPARSITPDFSFTRSQSGFEDVNVLYHISVFKQHIDNLGFNSLVNYQIHADTHGLNGQDNSNFNSFFNPPRLTFGEGGVDDAEDADVIIHEYSHALSYSATGVLPSGNERAALDEGNSDFFAASYSKSINPFLWERVYTWDGHNEFWSGRMVTSSKTYPASLTGNLYTDADIWSSSLMEIWDDIGRDKTEAILLQSLYSYFSGMKMSDAALLYIQADSLLYAGQNYQSICSRFKNRGLVNSCLLNVSDNSAIENEFIFNNITAFSMGGVVEILNTKGSEFSISLYDIAGKLLFSENSKNNKVAINGSWFSSGYYVLHSKLYDGRQVSRFLVRY